MARNLANHPPLYGPPPGPYVPPPPQPYSAPRPGLYPPTPPRTNWWAIVSLVFGILGAVVISVICGIVALKKARNGQQSGRGMAIAGLVLSGLWVLLLAAGTGIYLVMDKGAMTPASSSDSLSVTADEVKVGECLAKLPDSSRVASVDVVPCAQPHKGEVFTVLTMPDGVYPDRAAIEEYKGRCEPELATYSLDAAVDPAIKLFAIYPTEESWNHGHRTVTCIAASDFDRTGSLAG